jgi:hypothetical protein
MIDQELASVGERKKRQIVVSSCRFGADGGDAAVAFLLLQPQQAQEEECLSRPGFKNSCDYWLMLLD